VIELEEVAPLRQQLAPDGGRRNLSAPPNTSMARQRKGKDADRPHPEAKLDTPGSRRSKEGSSASPLSLATKAGQERGHIQIHQESFFLLLAASAGQENDLFLASKTPAKINRQFI
jgi:hypothetical protein